MGHLNTRSWARRSIILVLIFSWALDVGASEFNKRIAIVEAAGNDARTQVPLLIDAINAWEASDGNRRLALVCSGLAGHLGELGQDKEAETFYARAVAVNPKDIDHRINHSASLLRLGRIDESIAESMVSYRYDHENGAALANLCSAYTIIEDFTRALPYCEKAVKRMPSSAAFQGLATVYAELGRHQEAAEMLATARKSPQTEVIYAAERQAEGARIRFVETYVSSLAGRWDEGEKTLAAMMKENPAAMEPYFMRGRARLRSGNYDGAIVDFDKAYAMKPTTNATLWYRARAKQKAGRAAGAAEDRAKACRGGWMPACPKKRGTAE